MIQSKQYQAPKSDDASGMRDINNAIVDSGYRFGQQVYQLILRQEGNATPNNIDLDTLDSIEFISDQRSRWGLVLYQLLFQRIRQLLLLLLLQLLLLTLI